MKCLRTTHYSNSVGSYLSLHLGKTLDCLSFTKEKKTIKEVYFSILN